MFIDIAIDYAEIVRRQARWDKAMAFEFPDRVPVLHYLGARFWLPHVGKAKGFREYLNDPRVMLEAQLNAGKWILENVDSDFHKIVCYPDFMWAEDSESFGAQFVYPEDDSPWLERPHLLQQNDDLERLRNVDYVHGGIHGKMLEFYRQMKDMAGDYTIRFRDGMTLNGPDLVYMGGGGIIGPTVMASDLCGQEMYSLACVDRPEYIKELLSIISEKSIQWMDAAWEVSGGRTAFANDFHEGFLFVGDDGTAQMSPRHVEEFALAPLVELSRHIKSKGLKVMAHNCGKADHLLKYWMDDVNVDRYIGISYRTDKRKLAEIMGGKVTLIGGVDTTNLSQGTPESVDDDVRKALEILKKVPGFVLMDGHNVAPGTPVENLNAVTVAARKYGSFE
jgi:hypothetical protein